MSRSRADRERLGQQRRGRAQRLGSRLQCGEQLLGVAEEGLLERASLHCTIRATYRSFRKAILLSSPRC